MRRELAHEVVKLIESWGPNELSSYWDHEGDSRDFICFELTERGKKEITELIEGWDDQDRVLVPEGGGPPA